MDRVTDAAPDQRPRCGAKLKGLKPRKTHQRVVIDPEEAERGLAGTRTLWNVHRIPCPRRGKPVSGGEKVNAEKGYTYGHGIRAHALLQHTEHGTPPAEIAERPSLLPKQDTPTAQTVRNWINHTAQTDKPLLQALLSRAKEEKYMEVDETGLPTDGEKNRLWTLSTRTVTIHLARETRGHKAAEEPPRDHTGDLITDSWKAHDKLPHRKQRRLRHPYRRPADTLKKQVKTTNKLSEELRRSEEENQRPREEEQEEKNPRRRGRPRKPRALDDEQKNQHTLRIAELRVTTEALHQTPSLLKDATERGMSAEQAKERLLTLLEENEAAERFSEDYRRISKPIRKHIDELFLEEPGLPNSTNTAEGEIKPFANMRARTPSYRSPTSAEADADLLSYSTTWKKANLDPRELHQLLARGSWKTVYRRTERAFRKPPPQQAPSKRSRRCPQHPKKKEEDSGQRKSCAPARP
ncbi:MAG: IS66 family transposase [Candidatus Freyarchaeota archaeon]